MPLSEGVTGDKLQQAPDNEGDASSSAFPKGEKTGRFFDYPYSCKCQTYLKDFHGWPEPHYFRFSGGRRDFLCNVRVDTHFPSIRPFL
jgi:hypothetical protein